MNIDKEFYQSIDCGALFKKIAMAQDPAHMVQLLFAEFPLAQFWRFSVDGKKQMKDSWPGFEAREPKYLQGMYSVLLTMLEEINTPLNSRGLLNYHFIATQSVEMKRLPDELKGCWRKEDVYFGLLDDNASVEGILALLDRIEIGDDTFLLARDNVSLVEEIEIEQYDIINSHTYQYVLNDKIDFLVRKRGMIQEDPKTKECAKRLLAEFILKHNYSFRTQQHEIYKLDSSETAIEIITPTFVVEEFLQEKVDELIRLHYKRMTIAKDSEQKLSIIVDTVQKLEQLHPFKDANCRIFVMVILNKLLLENGFPPCMLYDPNCFDAFSNDQLIHEVKVGMKRFQDVLLNGKQLENTPTVDVLSHEMDIYFKKINEMLRQKMEEILSGNFKIEQTFLPTFNIACTEKHDGPGIPEQGNKSGLNEKIVQLTIT